MKVIDITFTFLEEEGYSSVTDFCRYLVSTGGKFENTKIHVYRGEMLCLIVNNIYEASKLTVRENGKIGPTFDKHKPMPEKDKERLRLKGVRK